MIPYGRQNINAADRAAVDRVLRSPFITQGPAIARFEGDVQRATRAKQAVAVANGTVALHLAYLAAGIGRGDEVIMPANTFVATANAALYLGAKPVFADIELRHYNIDPRDIARRITKRTKAIVVVHFAGHPCNMNAIQRLAKRHRLAVIEDGAHALGASYRGRPIGGLSTTATTLSFHPVKSITTGEGGMVTTPSRPLADRLRSLRSHGVAKDKRGWNVMTELGYNYRLTDLQAALGSSQMKRLRTFVAKRHQVVRWYRRHLSPIPGIILPTEDRSVVSAWHIYVIRTVNPRLRDRLAEHLKAHGVGANFHYPPVYWHPFYRRHGYRRTTRPNTEAYGRSCVTLPLHTLMTESDVRSIARAIASFMPKPR